MTPLEELLHRRWILKSEDIDLYLRVKDSIKEIRKIAQDKFGYIVLVTPYLIKLEKIPGRAEPWMGIQEFQTIREYQMYCYILMFLEDKEREEQFVLSNLTEYIQMQFPDGEIVWTNFTTRRQLIRVMKYCVSIGLMKLNDGSEDHFAQDMETEVLYENSGISRYVLRNFMRDIMEYQKPEDFEQSEWISMEEDRGIVRRQRVYRRLLLSPGVYRDDNDDDDFLYIRNYRNQLTSDFQSFFPCDLHIHKSSAYINLAQECSMGNVFPFNNTISDLIILLLDELRRRIKLSQLKLEAQEQVYIEEEKLKKIGRRIIQNKMSYLPKKYQETGAEQVSEDVIQQMKRYGFIEECDHGMLRLHPICGKIGGNYRMEGEEHADK